MARRMETIKTFAQYICVFDPMAQIPPKGMFGKCHGRTIPIAITLLWSTGMCSSEACRLIDDDVDLNNGLITIRETKFSKVRVLPLHETMPLGVASNSPYRANLNHHLKWWLVIEAVSILVLLHLI